ncbi:hypothetical protein, partial [Klebsiella pneumoniae]|uniref:hypothetical protein n=1 Tax=Klebsiella pneumoniae TaxID=573 RepID=UPI003012FF93
ERQAAELERQKRGPGSNRRWVLHGAAITAGLVVVLAAGWLGLEQWRMRTSFGDASLTVLESSAEQALKPKDTFKECD